jgi:hypothetical protein
VSTIPTAPPENGSLPVSEAAPKSPGILKSKPSLGRHEHHCTVCSHPHHQEIEQDWIGWGNTSRIAKQYRVSRDALYRHAHALDLFTKRQRNIRKALERIIEQAETVEVSASAVVAAIQAYAKINNAGQWVEHVQGTNMNELFDRMTKEELDAYARDGSLPEWFASAVGATGGDSQGGPNES